MGAHVKSYGRGLLEDEGVVESGDYRRAIRDWARVDKYWRYVNMRQTLVRTLVIRHTASMRGFKSFGCRTVDTRIDASTERCPSR